MATAVIPQRARWLLLALYYAREKGLTPVQMQKALFVLGARRPDTVRGPGFYNFQPYHYGPSDSRVYADADDLSAKGYVTLDTSLGWSMREYKLTPQGAAMAETIRSEVPLDGASYLREVVEWAQRLSFNELVRSVYEAFPEMRANSVFRD